MKMFSSILLDLYEMATNTAPEQFVKEMIRLIRRRIMFDGALYGTGLADENGNGNLIIERAMVYQREESLLKIYAALSEIDPICKAIASGLPAPFSCTPQRYYQQRNLPELQRFTTQYRIKNMLVYGYPPTEERTGRWLMLFRDTSRSFNRADAVFLQALWPHLFRAVQDNLFHILHRNDLQESHHASGLINSHGVVEFADTAFFPLLQLECPNCRSCQVPPLILSTVIRNGIFHGKHIDLTGRPYFDYLMCMASRTCRTAAALSTTERQVAHCFAQGMTHKEIALKFGTSPHTVRMQIKTVYRKLDLHRKSDLARAIALAWSA